MTSIDPIRGPRSAGHRRAGRAGALVQLGVLAAAAVLLAWRIGLAQPLDKAVQTTVQKNRDSAASQSRVDALHDQTSHLAQEYRDLLEQHETLQVYNRQVETLIAAQTSELESLNRQIGEVTNIGRELVPLMKRMIDWLEEFVAADVPFLMEERTKRVSGLREMMDRADVSDSEKFRRLLEAYQIEVEYGHTIEAYRGTLTDGGRERTVNYLRIGRLVLAYETLDRREVGVWRQSGPGTEPGWEKLPRRYGRALQEGFRVAQKQVAPDLIWLPVAAPQAASAKEEQP